MLKELNNVKQFKDEGHRRWFTDENYDHIVWYDHDDRLEGFQFCYDKQGDERALTWYRSGSYTHTKVDSGQDPMSSRKSPVLVSDGVFDASRMAAEFKQVSNNIDPQLADLVYAKIHDYI